MENRRYKILGFLLAVLGFIPLGWLTDKLEGQWASLAGQEGSLLLTALASLNVIAAGLLLMAAGLGKSRLAVDARRRRAVILQMLLANLLLPVLFLGFWMDRPDADARSDLSATEIALAAGGYVVAFGAWRLWRRTQRYSALAAAEVMATDPRPPVLYLRSFRDDGAVLQDAEQGRIANWTRERFAVATPEEESAAALDTVGPVVAIGRPGEPLPEIGAARLYVDHASWQSEVSALMDRAALVVLRIGSSPGLLWEIEQTLARVPRQRVVFVLIGDAPVSQEVAARLEPEFGAAWRAALPDEPASPSLFGQMRFGPSKRRLGALVCFPGGVARVVAVSRARSGANDAAWWRKPLASLGRAWRPLPAAWHEVIASLGLQKEAHAAKSRTMAILLACLFGILGAHWFYLGRYRRGALYVGLIPLMGLSLFLAWYDALRFLWVDRIEFERGFASVAAR